MGAWIEILVLIYFVMIIMSLLSWERGLKFLEQALQHGFLVAPLVGAWIEIKISKVIFNPVNVAPLVGAWIEII